MRMCLCMHDGRIQPRRPLLPCNRRCMLHNRQQSRLQHAMRNRSRCNTQQTKDNGRCAVCREDSVLCHYRHTAPTHAWPSHHKICERARTRTRQRARERAETDASVQARGHTVVCTARCAPELGDGVVGGVHCARTLHACTKAVSKAKTDSLQTNARKNTKANKQTKQLTKPALGQGKASTSLFIARL